MNQSDEGNHLTNKTSITLKALLDNLGDPGRWNNILQPALNELNRRHPEMNIHLQYKEFYYNESRKAIFNELANGADVDLVSVDQIWVGQFAEKGLLLNLTDNFEKWKGASDMYESNLDGSIYNNTIYGLWLWTDVRGTWYWIDILKEAGIDPNSLKTWDGYISAATKLNAIFKDKGIQGVHLLSAPHDPDMWYPYLWMLGGEILQLREGHPTKGVYWFPSYNSSAGIRALEFLKRQVDSGIQPQNKQFEKEFANRKFAVMLAGSWMPGEFPKQEWPKLRQELGFIPMFPVPNATTFQTATMMGGWELSVPSSSRNAELAWELITTLAQPEILGPFLKEYGYLPTQGILGDGPYSKPLKESVPFYEEMISMIPYGRTRPNIPEYPEIAGHIHQAIQQVYNGTASPKDALNMAAAKSAEILGWKTH